MKFFPELKSTVSMFIVVFFLSIIILLGVIEFGFLKNILVNYEDSIKQVAINKTSLLLNDIKSASENSAKWLESPDTDLNEAAKKISAYDHRITGVYILKPEGTPVKWTADGKEGSLRQIMAEVAAREKSDRKVTVSGVHVDPELQINIVSAVIPLPGNDGYLAIDFRVDQYQREMMHEFNNRNYKIAVFDSENKPVFWPFEIERLVEFDKGHGRFYENSRLYNVIHSELGEQPWRMFFFFKENNFETFRTIAILFLVFALYCCLYQLLVELWGVNSVRTYFENIDFAIFNQINEGVIITNNSGKIIFANSTAHEIFSERKRSLMGVKLKEILGHVEGASEEKEKSQLFTLKMSDRLLEGIHSPIIKKGKKLGSLTVIRADVKEEKMFRSVLSRFIEIIPEGVLYVDKNHEVGLANLMARCYLGNLDKGTSIDVVDHGLAQLIYECIGSGSLKRMELGSYGLVCEISPVYDDDGIYAGTLVVLVPVENENRSV